MSDLGTTQQAQWPGRHKACSFTVAGWVVVGALLCGSLTASAQVQRVEAVGSYGIKEADRSKVIARDQAIGKALWEGVSRVAIDLIGGSDSSDPAVLRGALGQDILPYTRSFRILDDRGEVPVMFAEDPDVNVEYVVVVEVLVDEDRVTNALEGAGLLASRGDGFDQVSSSVRIELVGLSRYAALETVVEALREDLGATRVQVLEFSRARQVLSVEGPFAPAQLSARLAGLDRPQLVLEPIGVDDASGLIRLLGRWFPDSTG